MSTRLSGVTLSARSPGSSRCTTLLSTKSGGEEGGGLGKAHGRDDPTEGSMREYADGRTGHGVKEDNNEPQGAYTDTDVDELESHHEVGGGSGSGQGDDEPSAYEDACRDEEI
nr:hypothetical protein [Tanacetum cinerariifolium]